MDGRIYRLASDTYPRFVAVDMAKADGETTVECEIELLPGGIVNVLDIREVM